MAIETTRSIAHLKKKQQKYTQHSTLTKVAVKNTRGIAHLKKKLHNIALKHQMQFKIHVALRI